MSATPSRHLGTHVLHRAEAQVSPRSRRRLRAEDLYIAAQHHVATRCGGVYRGSSTSPMRASSAVDARSRSSIVSAGYGLVAGAEPTRALRAHVPGHVQRATAASWRDARHPARRATSVAAPSRRTSHVVLLGEDYLDACELAGDLAAGGPDPGLLRRTHGAPHAADRRTSIRLRSTERHAALSLRPRRPQGRGRRTTPRVHSRADQPSIDDADETPRLLDDLVAVRPRRHRGLRALF